MLLIRTRFLIGTWFMYVLKRHSNDHLRWKRVAWAGVELCGMDGGHACRCRGCERASERVEQKKWYFNLLGLWPQCVELCIPRLAQLRAADCSDYECVRLLTLSFSGLFTIFCISWNLVSCQVPARLVRSVVQAESLAKKQWISGLWGCDPWNWAVSQNERCSKF